MSDSQVLSYCGGQLDRAARLRRDPAWLRAQLASSGARIYPLWRDRCLVRDGSAVSLAESEGDPVFLGIDSAGPVFAVDLSELAEEAALAVAGADAAVDVRRLVGGLSAADAGLLAYARGLCHWHRNQRFCGACGSSTRWSQAGHVLLCTGCAREIYPRIEPAIIVLVESAGPPTRCLLARHAGAGPDSYALLAGFVEVGESLEDAVRREVAEESGVVLDTVTYQASQAWPFPAGLMLGFRARAVDDATDVDGDELVEARWFTREALRDRRRARGRLGNVDSIDRYLLESWLAEASM